MNLCRLYRSLLLMAAVALVAATGAWGQITFTASMNMSPIENPLQKILDFGQTIDGEKLDPLDYFLEDVLPPLYGQRANNENGTRAEFKRYALEDQSNDDASHLSGVSIFDSIKEVT